MIKEQSESVVRGDHPLTFVLPTVSSHYSSNYVLKITNKGCGVI